jgi:hypothetical protein
LIGNLGLPRRYAPRNDSYEALLCHCERSEAIFARKWTASHLLKRYTPRLKVQSYRHRANMKMSIYRIHLGESFDRLPAEVRVFHELRGTHRVAGRAEVVGPQSFIGRLLGIVFRLPPAGADLALDVEMVCDEKGECWTRSYPGRLMRSRISLRGAYLVEKIGPVGLWFRLQADDVQLSMHLRRMTVFGIPLPPRMHPRVRAVETATPGRFHFDIATWLPRRKLLVAYKGYLELKSLEPEP